jgi:Sec-independent protein translocase protein TatA
MNLLKYRQQISYHGGKMAPAKIRVLSLIIWLVVFSATAAPSAASGWGDIIKDVQKALGGGESVTETEIIQGLKEALHIGTAEAIKEVLQIWMPRLEAPPLQTD